MYSTLVRWGRCVHRVRYRIAANRMLLFPNISIFGHHHLRAVMSTPAYLKHLRSDPVLAAVLRGQEDVTLKQEKHIYLYLCYNIMSQQLSTRVAEVLQQRFHALYPVRRPTAQQIYETPVEVLRGIGLSQAKANYVKNVAAFELEHGMQPVILNRMEDAEVKRYLTQIKGVGNWTVEMLLMFALGREDVFAPDDLGIQQAMHSLYRLPVQDQRKRRQRMERIAEKWAPYRTYACIHLWRMRDSAGK